MREDSLHSLTVISFQTCMKFLILWSTKEKKNWRTLGSKTTVDLNNFNCMAQKPSQHQDIQICIRFVSGFLFRFSPFSSLFFFFFFSLPVLSCPCKLFIHLNSYGCCNAQMTMLQWPNDVLTKRWHRGMPVCIVTQELAFIQIWGLLKIL